MTAHTCHKDWIINHVQARSQDFQKGGYLGMLCVMHA